MSEESPLTSAQQQQYQKVKRKRRVLLDEDAEKIIKQEEREEFVRVLHDQYAKIDVNQMGTLPECQGDPCLSLPRDNSWEYWMSVMLQYQSFRSFPHYTDDEEQQMKQMEWQKEMRFQLMQKKRAIKREKRRLFKLKCAWDKKRKQQQLHGDFSSPSSVSTPISADSSPSVIIDSHSSDSNKRMRFSNEMNNFNGLYPSNYNYQSHPTMMNHSLENNNGIPRPSTAIIPSTGTINHHGCNGSSFGTFPTSPSDFYVSSDEEDDNDSFYGDEESLTPFVDDNFHRAQQAWNMSTSGSDGNHNHQNSIGSNMLLPPTSQLTSMMPLLPPATELFFNNHESTANNEIQSNLQQPNGSTMSGNDNLQFAMMNAPSFDNLYRHHHQSQQSGHY